MKKWIPKIAAAALAVSLITTSAFALSHTVVRGDTMWKLAVKYQVGTSEIISANPQVQNPDLIYPGQVLTIPEADASVTAFEQEVVRLVNEVRAQNGWMNSSGHRANILNASYTQIGVGYVADGHYWTQMFTG